LENKTGTFTIGGALKPCLKIIPVIMIEELNMKTTRKQNELNTLFFMENEIIRG
jgi:hypothetical protein